ncbi:hypothetical protein GCM10011360_04270 [Primorskyibacter flagellatus]|uniref:VPLPA-CTERM protein sorting domain-containing protein n=1 Tax=Primorskyibacter flagellatus TaxID=1387277 RepID=A0A916ZZ81_9RHOB|nr:VPLPA-CTERM sorting domain-containing protein [Primorskyibacter flagellatus]GGE18651.1 hypothetical protein GCM10011360_04270 [Primorskyibacter flagellatus]
MNILRTAALVAGLAFAPFAASAATCDVGTCFAAGADGQTLTSAGLSYGAYNIVNDGSNGFNFFALFDRGATDIIEVVISILTFQPTGLGYINDLEVSFFGGGSTLPQAVTNGSGFPINPVGNDVILTFDLTGFDTMVGIDIEGFAVAQSGANPGFNVTVRQAPPAVPVPAAGLLLAGALGGLAALRRRKKD